MCSSFEPQSPEERRVGQLEDQDIIHYDTHTHTPYTHTHTQYTTTVPVLESVERGRLRVTFGLILAIYTEGKGSRDFLVWGTCSRTSLPLQSLLQFNLMQSQYSSHTIHTCIVY